MFNKKRLMIMTLALLIAAVTFLAACEYVTDEGLFVADELVDELIEDSKATPAPTVAATPTPTPKKVGFFFSDEQIERIKGLWPVQNASVDDFGELYAVYADNDWTHAGSYLTFEYHSDETPEQLQEDFGVPILGMKLPELYYTGEWQNETNEDGQPLQISVNIGQMPEYNSVFLSFNSSQRHQVVVDLHNEFWPSNWQSNGALTDENTTYSGIGFFPGTNGIELWRSFQLMPAGALPVYNGFESEFAEQPDFKSIPADGYIAPRISFSYDIKGDGTTIADTNIFLYDSSDMIQVSFSRRLEF